VKTISSRLGIYSLRVLTDPESRHPHGLQEVPTSSSQGYNMLSPFLVSCWVWTQPTERFWSQLISLNKLNSDLNSSPDQSPSDYTTTTSIFTQPTRPEFLEATEESYQEGDELDARLLSREDPVRFDIASRHHALIHI
jgi:hypothetical protein